VLAASTREFDDLVALADEETADSPVPATPVSGLAMEAGRPGGGRRPSSPGGGSPVISLYPDGHPGRDAGDGLGAPEPPAPEAGRGAAPAASGEPDDGPRVVDVTDDDVPVAAARG
jgi:hypothetical protein